MEDKTTHNFTNKVDFMIAIYYNLCTTVIKIVCPWAFPECCKVCIIFPYQEFAFQLPKV